MICYLVCVALGIIAMLISMLDRISAFVLGAVLFAFALYMLWYMEFGPWKLTSNTQTTASPSSA